MSQLHSSVNTPKAGNRMILLGLAVALAVASLFVQWGAITIATSEDLRESITINGENASGDAMGEIFGSMMSSMLSGMRVPVSGLNGAPVLDQIQLKSRPRRTHRPLIQRMPRGASCVLRKLDVRHSLALRPPVALGVVPSRPGGASDVSRWCSEGRAQPPDSRNLIPSRPGGVLEFILTPIEHEA